MKKYDKSDAAKNMLEFSMEFLGRHGVEGIQIGSKKYKIPSHMIKKPKDKKGKKNEKV